MLHMFFWLLVGHAVADFALQNDFVAKFKSSKAMWPPGSIKEHFRGSTGELDVRIAMPGVRREIIWPWVLGSHALIHGGAVALVTGKPLLGVFEAVAHAVIDHCKCNDYIDFHVDQALHLACKVVWLILVPVV
jgi:hypothetical protein